MAKNKSPLSILDKTRRRRLNNRLRTLRERAQLLEIELQSFSTMFYRVCIFGSARIKPDDETYKLTYEIAQNLGELGIDVLTGGGPGLMEAANKGVLAGKAQSGSRSKSFGLTIELNAFEEEGNEHLDIKHHHRRFSSRLDDFMRLSHAVIVVPGGIGTLLELYFSWQLLQVGHLQSRPIILVGKEFWGGLLDWMHEQQEGNGLVSPGDFKWVTIVDTPEQVREIIDPHHSAFIEEMKKNPPTP